MWKKCKRDREGEGAKEREEKGGREQRVGERNRKSLALFSLSFSFAPLSFAAKERKLTQSFSLLVSEQQRRAVKDSSFCFLSHAYCLSRRCVVLTILIINLTTL